MKGENPLDIQQKRITPISNMLRAATGIVTTYTVDVAVIWVQPGAHNEKERPTTGTPVV